MENKLSHRGTRQRRRYSSIHSCAPFRAKRRHAGMIKPTKHHRCSEELVSFELSRRTPSYLHCPSRPPHQPAEQTRVVNSRAACTCSVLTKRPCADRDDTEPQPI
ncbi:hypothetical protein C2845_PM13G14100 [Panicum miliaceum]|uniref:Uncharacterized protein n=1 Tax=Panicum miliaceum TaxID=4540 RepID=A0A3L6RLR7_PANMI|nr:hypothetical protein C2845_PM13G14100 [Panicum miliaceum]